MVGSVAGAEKEKVKSKSNVPEMLSETDGDATGAMPLGVFISEPFAGYSLLDV